VTNETDSQQSGEAVRERQNQHGIGFRVDIRVDMGRGGPMTGGLSC